MKMPESKPRSESGLSANGFNYKGVHHDSTKQRSGPQHEWPLELLNKSWCVSAWEPGCNGLAAQVLEAWPESSKHRKDGPAAVPELKNIASC